MATAGGKRVHRGQPRQPKEPVATTAFTPMFEQFRDELDEHYDRKERITKASRDVTAASKKMIFCCHRVRDQVLGRDFNADAAKDVSTRMTEALSALQTIENDIQGINRHRYSYQLPCLEEFVEAYTFAIYLQRQMVISAQEVERALPPSVRLTDQDYANGLFDLFGEMMRYATVSSAQAGSLAGSDGETGRNVLGDMHELAAGFETLPVQGDKKYGIKIDTMRQSVKKVERLGYSLVIRGSERPKGWMPDLKDDADVLMED